MKPALRSAPCVSVPSALAALALLATSHSVTANELDLDIRPGLWEHSIQMQSDSGQMEQAIAEARRQIEQLPENQRRMMEELMTSQGITLDLTGTTLQVCIREEDIARGAFPQQDNCEHTITRQGQDEFAFRFECAGDPPYSGTGTMNIVDREHYQGDGEFTIRIAGNPERVTMQQEGRWLAAECND